MNRYQEIKHQQAALQTQIHELDKEVVQIQRACRHQNTSISGSYDGYEQRSYDDYTCNDCGYKWSE